VAESEVPSRPRSSETSSKPSLGGMKKAITHTSNYEAEKDMKTAATDGRDLELRASLVRQPKETP
jgi:hypothetical protein